MKLIALTLLLVVMQAVSPSSRKTANNTAAVPQTVPSSTEAPYDHRQPAPVAQDETKSVFPQQAPGEERIQRKLTWFTGILAVVGVLQLIVMFLTWRVYSRQAGIMEQQRETMQNQWTTMQGQLTQMVNAGQKTDSLIAQTVIQTEKTGIAANAAKQSADTAKDNVRLIIEKERSRITVEIPSKLTITNTMFNTINFKVHVFAPTPAIIIDAQVGAQITDSRDLKTRWLIHAMNLSSIQTRMSSVIEKNTVLFENGNGLMEAINAKTKFVHFWGIIKYKDVFQSDADKPHETVFGYIWEVGADVAGGFPKIGEGRWMSEWVEHPPNDNRET
jgi:hypothetical protein